MFKYIEYVQNSEELSLVFLMFRPVLLQKFEEYLSKLHSQTVDSNETLSHVKVSEELILHLLGKMAPWQLQDWNNGFLKSERTT